MDRGEIWESGTPEQVFGNPLRDETRAFVFRIRSWECELAYPDYDHPAMEASLTEFCSRQFLGRRLTSACQHVVEELVAQRLATVAHEAGASGATAALTLAVAEGGETATLVVDCHDLVAHGVGPKQLESGSDPISDALITGYARRMETGDPSIMRYEIA